MGEIEKLLAVGFISEDFLKEETRCEYVISHNIKRVWDIQLNILSEFIEVCASHNLQYWVDGGTLLGAVRHNGYIPWDDDIDVIMPRKDYDKLICNPGWFSGENQLHIPNSHDKYYEGWARVHNINTAVLYNNYEEEGSKQGIYIDVFPLDNYNGAWQEKRDLCKIDIMNKVGHAYSYNVNPSMISKIISRISRMNGFFCPEKAYRYVNLLATSKKNTDSMLVPKMVMGRHCAQNPYRQEAFDSTITMRFEFLQVNVPIGYDEILTKLYGNYMQFPPKEKRGCWHSFLFDTDKPFSTYIKRKD